MSLYRRALPQLGKDFFLADGGLETDLMFNDGVDLPLFASFVLLKSAEGRNALKAYYMRYAAVAQRYKRGVVFETATWRASRDWGPQLGYDDDALAGANRAAVDLLVDLRAIMSVDQPVVISGDIGPRGDGYDPGALMSAKEAEDYHSFQADIFAETEADLITGMTITNVPEAIGIARAGAAAKMPVVMSLTVETDGRLPTGQPLGEAIMEIDFESPAPPAYYMVNCAHPTHFAQVLKEGGSWLSRLRGVRANASKCSHAELDEAETLDIGDPTELGDDNLALWRLAPSLNIFGGCCGTDHRHIEALAKALMNSAQRAA